MTGIIKKPAIDTLAAICFSSKVGNLIPVPGYPVAPFCWLCLLSAFESMSKQHRSSGTGRSAAILNSLFNYRQRTLNKPQQALLYGLQI